MTFPEIKKIPPATITEFRNYSGELENLAIPERPENRKCTDIGFIIFFVIVITATIILTGCAAMHTDYYRFLNGYDKCGDTCGVKNKPIENIKCSGKDLANKPIMQFKYYKNKRTSLLMADECIEKCNESSFLYFHRCFPKTNTLSRASSRMRAFNVLNRKSYIFKIEKNNCKKFQEFVHDLKSSILCICIMSFIGLVFSFVLFLCFRYYTQGTVMAILVLHIVGLLTFAGYVWYWFIEDTKKSELLYIGITAAVIAFFLSIFICYFHDRYSLVIQLFTEAMLAIFRVPLLLLIPFLTLIFLAIFVTSTVFLSALISTNQVLKKSEIDPSVHEYTLSDTGIACLTLLAFATAWIFAFANGCQCMIISGVVAEHYFARDKPLQNSTVYRSFYVLMRYHLGTVVFGSLVITIVMSARVMTEFIRNHDKCKKVILMSECCLTCLEQFVDYLTKRAYIQTAMHGKTLCKSGMRAARLLWSNLMDTIALDVVGDFIMFCALILVLLIAIGIGIAINFNKGLVYFWAVLITGAAAAGTITYFFTQVINVAIETIFLCFCEDKLLNDGKDRPYFMSPELKSVIDKAKRAARQREE